MQGPVVTLDERIKTIATAAAAGALLVFGVLALIAPSDPVLLSTAASAIALVVFGAAWKIKAVPSTVIVVTTVALGVTAPILIESPFLSVNAAVAIVTVSIVGVELVKNRHSLYIAAMSLTLLSYPIFAYSDRSDAIAVGAVSTVCFLLGVLVLRAASNEREELRQSQTALLELAPVLILESDWTEAESRVRALGISDPDDLRRYLLDHPDLVAELVGTVEILASNPAAREAVGKDGSSFWRMDPSRVHGGSLLAFTEQLVSIFTDRPFHDFEYETTRNDGSPIVVTLRAVVNRRHPGQTRVLVAAQDVTERKTSQVALQKALTSKDAFIAEVSHELRTPLAAIVGLTASVLEGDHIPENDRELLEIVRSQGEEMAYIIEDLLVAARSDNRSITVDISVVDAYAEVLSVASKWDVEVVAPAETVRVMADPVRTRQVLRNLLTNAARYGKAPVRVEISPKGEHVEVAVSDGGDAIPDEHRERIFEPYLTAHGDDARTGSIGLGLAISRSLARLMTGDLKYHHDGRSVFTLILPRHIEEGATQ
jgi:signal transduction histidine kinase